MSSAVAMRVAQRLYENGHITYMRTDSTTLSATAIAAARSAATQIFGAENVSDTPRQYTRKVKNAQEAHEAIRPSGDHFRTPGELAGQVSPDELALYDLIWKRTVASQMSDALGQTASVRLGAVATDGRDAEFGASGTVITHRGFLAAYEEGRDEPTGEDAERRLPALAVGATLTASSLDSTGHETQPPARYTEATLVKALEERGIGRPSTYASILGVILDRGYVFKKGTALVPSWLAFAVTRLLEQHFGELVDYDFTAQMEEDLDRIAAGEAERVAWLSSFYFGDGPSTDELGGLRALVENLGDIDARDVNTVPIGDGITLRVGRYGPYLERGEERASVPDDLAPDELTVARASELLAAPSGDRVLGANPENGLEILARVGRFGPYVTEALPEGAGRGAKPRTASLFKDMSLDSVNLQDALRLLSLPRTVGVDPESGEPITAQNGRYGPYLRKGTDSRSLENEDQLFTVTLEEALAIYAQPKARGRGRGAAAAPLRELGADPVSGQPIVVREGRFGPYVTDGETNATLRSGDTIEAVTVERAAELLADKRSRGPAKKTAKKATKKAPAKSAAKSVAKSPPKKAPAKKVSAKKSG
jgi:DNA topoisomerase-1